MTEKEFCDGCRNEAFKECLISCDANLLRFHWREFLKSLPVIGDRIETYECQCKEKL